MVHGGVAARTPSSSMITGSWENSWWLVDIWHSIHVFIHPIADNWQSSLFAFGRLESLSLLSGHLTVTDVQWHVGTSWVIPTLVAAVSICDEKVWLLACLLTGYYTKYRASESHSSDLPKACRCGPSVIGMLRSAGSAQIFYYHIQPSALDSSSSILWLLWHDCDNDF